MPVDQQIPDYDLDDMVVVTAPEQLRALADPLRTSLLELLLERAATVTEMAQAVHRPKSTVGYHVNSLVDVGLLRIVRTRRVRAIEERYYGRVARTLYIGVLNHREDKQVVAAVNGLAEAAAEFASAHADDELRCLLVHARIPIEEVRDFWAQVQEVARRFAQFPGPATRSTASPPASTPPTPPPSPTPSAARRTDATSPAPTRPEPRSPIRRPRGGAGDRFFAQDSCANPARRHLPDPPTMCVSRNYEPQGGPPSGRSVVSPDLSGCRPAEVRQRDTPTDDRVTGRARGVQPGSAAAGAGHDGAAAPSTIGHHDKRDGLSPEGDGHCVR